MLFLRKAHNQAIQIKPFRCGKVKENSKLPKTQWGKSSSSEMFQKSCDLLSILKQAQPSEHVQKQSLYLLIMESLINKENFKAVRLKYSK